MLIEKIAKLKNKKGASTIEIVIGLMIFILLFGFMLDLIVLTWKFNVVAQTNTQIARIAGLQGGIQSSAPNGWAGGNSSYISSSQMQRTVLDKMNSAGIKPGDWTVRIGNGTITSGSAGQSKRYDYLETFTTKVEVRYTWDFMSMMLPGNFSQSLSSERPAMSEWKYNYNIWTGE